jgi:LemA protein
MEKEETMGGVLLVILVLIVLVVIAVIAIYNSLVGLRQRVRNAWSQIDVQLKRRYDLIPNLVETVKGYAKHEKETLERVVQARNAAVSAQGVEQQAQAENILTGALRQLFALSESYPDLKANQNFLALQEELATTENRISFARQHYNDSTAIYNTRVQSFPANIIAGMFSFMVEPYFEIEDAAQRETPQVQF